MRPVWKGLHPYNLYVKLLFNILEGNMKNMLGENPVITILKAFGMVLGFFGLALFVSKGIGVGVFLTVALISMIFIPLVGIVMLGQLIAAKINSRIYKNAKKAVSENLVVPTYVGRNNLCKGIKG
jgi:hypothetical protein